MGLSRGLADHDELSGFQVRDLRDRLALSGTEAQRR
jgi:hypothetical protein